MSNSNTASSKFLLRVLFAVLFTFAGLASCSGGNSATTTNNTTTNRAAPTVALTATSTSIAYNASTTINWSSTNSTSCASSSGTGGIGTSGSINTGAMTATTIYTVTCIGAGGVARQSITITVAPSTITGFASGGVGFVTVTSVNDLISGSIITISGTTNYNGTYTVVSQTNTSFTIAASFVANDAAGIWQLAGSMIPGCSSTGDTGAIKLSNVPSRFNGVAPLAVFFDATGTVAPATKRPFHDLEYRWDFGDPTGSLSGTTTWNTGSRAGVSSLNSATGPVASHVFETPGKYIVTLSATDGTKTVSNNCAQIVVQNPDEVFSGANTICISTSGTFTGCPSGADTSTNPNFVTALSTNLATHKRILFRRGETFTAATSAAINVNGPGVIGAYGAISDPKPIVQMTSNVAILNLSSGSTHNIKDWRIIDLDFDGRATLGTIGIDTAGGIKQVLILNMHIHDIGEGIKFNHDILTYWYTRGDPTITMFDEMAVVGSTISGYPGLTTGSRMIVSANRLSIQGNTIGNELATMGNHVLRIQHMEKGVISNNTIARATAHVIKLHAQAWCDSTLSTPTFCYTTDNTSPPATYNYLTNTHPIGIFAPLSGYTEQVIISDNKLVGANNAWTVTLGPQNVNRDERLRDFIVERNWFTSGTGTQTAMMVWADETTIRNNICDMTGAAFHTCFRVTLQGKESPPENVRVYNNTFYSGSSGDFEAVAIGASASNVSIINNLGSAPFASSPVIYSDAGSTGLVQSSNLLNNSPTVLFGTASPVTPLDFRLSPTSPARDSLPTVIVPVFSDFFRSSRPQNGVADIGAVEGP